MLRFLHACGVLLVRSDFAHSVGPKAAAGVAVVVIMAPSVGDLFDASSIDPKKKAAADAAFDKMKSKHWEKPDSPLYGALVDPNKVGKWETCKPKLPKEYGPIRVALTSTIYRVNGVYAQEARSTAHNSPPPPSTAADHEIAAHHHGCC